MNEKIAWYREVLALEPGSKVFVPLARLLVEAEKVEEAAKVLRQGLELHPEFLEARLQLVEVEAAMGRSDDLSADALGIGVILGKYPAFWREWATALSGPGGPEGSDTAALAALQLAAYFQGHPVDWAEVIRKGLDATLPRPAVPRMSGDPSDGPEQATGRREDLPPVDVPARGEATVAVPVETPDTTVAATPSDSPQPSVADALPDDSLLETDPGTHARLGEDVTPETQLLSFPSDEASLRTRTMADILAEQGDINGALDIYRELEAASPAGLERQEFTEKIEELQARQVEIRQGDTSRLSTGSGAPDYHSMIEPEPVAQASPVAPTSKKKLVSALQALADRLETKSPA